MRVIFGWIFAIAACAQTAPTQAGLEPPWEMTVVLEQISKDTARLQPLLDQIAAPAWVEKGASETYLSQWQSSKDQAQAITIEAKALARNPEKLSAGLQLLFRFQGLENLLQSLEDAARRYQSAETAQTLAATFADSSANRDRFRTYLVNLAAEREHQFAVMDEEAQRCRALLMTPAPKTSVRKK